MDIENATKKMELQSTDGPIVPVVVIIQTLNTGGENRYCPEIALPLPSITYSLATYVSRLQGVGIRNYKKGSDRRLKCRRLRLEAL